MAEAAATTASRSARSIPPSRHHPVRAPYIAPGSRKPIPSARATARETLDLPDPLGPSMAMITRGKTNGPPGLPPPTTRLGGGGQLADGTGNDHDLREAERLPHAVLEVQVLQVDAGRTHVVQQPGELTRAVRDEDDDRLVCRVRSTVLAGDPGLSGVARGDRASKDGSGTAGRAVGVGDEGIEGGNDVAEVVAEVSQHLTHRRGVRREDLGPQVWVAGGDPCDVTQALAGEADGLVGQALEPGGDEAGSHLRYVRHGGHRRRSE